MIEFVDEFDGCYVLTQFAFLICSFVVFHYRERVRFGRCLEKVFNRRIVRCMAVISFLIYRVGMGVLD